MILPLKSNAFASHAAAGTRPAAALKTGTEVDMSNAWFNNLIPPADLIPECFPSFHLVESEKALWMYWDAMVFQTFWFDFNYCETFLFGMN